MNEANEDKVLLALLTAQNHLSQYREYSDQMAKTGKGFTIYGHWSEENAAVLIENAIAEQRRRAELSQAR